MQVFILHITFQNLRSSLAFPDNIRYNQDRITFSGGLPMENENLLPEEEVSILTLTDENGVDTTF